MNFIDLGLDIEVTKLLSDNNITSPTAIQKITIPKILEGNNIVAQSQTGSGKTLSYLLPIVQKLSDTNDDNLLIIAPTRELAQQIYKVCKSYTTKGSITSVVIYGGVDYEPQQEQLAANPRIIIATPGRMLDFISQGVVDITGLKYLILDEVDQLVDMGFRDPIKELSSYRGTNSQTLCFSATLSEDITSLIDELMGDYIKLCCDSEPLAAQNITQSGYYVEQSMMDQLLIHVMRMKSPTRSIVFCRSKKMADRLTSILKESSFAAEAIHSNRSQAAREHILSRFTLGETTVLVATDLVSRGIDVDGVTHVFNYGLPQNPEQYIHRIGRTGRAGACGESISLLCPDEKKLLGETCKLMRQNIPVSSDHPYMTPSVTTALLGVAPKKKTRK